MSVCGSVCVCVFPLCVLSDFMWLSVVVFPSVFLFRSLLAFKPDHVCACASDYFWL